MGALLFKKNNIVDVNYWSAFYRKSVFLLQNVNSIAVSCKLLVKFTCNFGVKMVSPPTFFSQCMEIKAHLVKN